MSRAMFLYCVAAFQLAVGFYILSDAYPEFQNGEIAPLNYVLRGVGWLSLAAAFIFLARKVRGTEGLNDA